MKSIFYFYLAIKTDYKTLIYSKNIEKNKDIAVKRNDEYVLKYYNYDIEFTIDRFINAYNNKIYKIIRFYLNKLDFYWLLNQVYIPNLSRIKKIDEKIHIMFKQKIPNDNGDFYYDRFNIIENIFDPQYYINRYTEQCFKLLFQTILDEYIKTNNNDIIKKIIDINRFSITLYTIDNCYKYNNYEIINYLCRSNEYKIKTFRTILKLDDISKLKYILEKYYFKENILASEIKSKKMYEYLISNNFKISEKELIRLAINLDDIELIDEIYKKMIYDEKEQIMIDAIYKNKIKIIKKIINDEKWDITKFKYKKNNTKQFIKEYFINLQK